MIPGTTRTLLRWKVWLGVRRVTWPVAVMGRGSPLPTVTRRGGGGYEEVESIPGSETMCEVAPESINHAPGVEGPAAGEPAVAFRAPTRAEQSLAGPGLYGAAGGSELVPQA